MRPIRLGMIGGGQGAFIGGVHRIAARIDGEYQLVAGALSSTPERAAASAAELGLDPARSYADFEAMAEAEAARPDGVEAVAIVTPNHLHAAPARAFLQRGIHVICDKPVTATLEEAIELERVARDSSALFVLTHNYTGYPMVRHARALVESGALGKIRLVQVEYAQDWMTEAVESQGSKQAAWRVDPQKSGLGGALGDIGSHAWNLAAFVTQMEPNSIAADLTSFGEGRVLDDNAQVLLRYASGAKGSLWCSQVAAGQENSLSLRVYGTKAGIEWRQEEPNHLWFNPFGQPRQLLTRAGAGAGPEAARVSRTPGGHPEGYLEAFANIYTEAARAIRAHQKGEAAPIGTLYPTLADGLSGLRFITACVSSAARDAAWVSP